MNGNPMIASGTPGGGRLSAQDAQQFGRELAQRLADAQALQRDLQRQGVNTDDLDRAIQNLRGMLDPSRLEETHAASDLKAQTIDGLKTFEFGLRRDADNDRVVIDRTGDVPPAYRQSVEEYYRAIGKAKPQKP